MHRHAQPVRAHVQQQQRRCGARRAAGGVRRAQRAPVARVHQPQHGGRGLPGPRVRVHVRRQRRAEQHRHVTHGVEPGPRQAQARGAPARFGQPRGRGQRLPRQCVQVEQVAQAVVEFAFVEEVAGAVQQQAERIERQHAVVPGHRHRALHQRRVVDAHARGVGQDRVVHVDVRAAPLVPHRRQLVHPVAVVLVVVGVHLGHGPAVLDERALDLGEPLARHEDVDIGKEPPAAGLEPEQRVRGAFQQHHRHRGRNGLADAAHLPVDHRPLPLGDEVGRQQVHRGVGRYVVALPAAFQHVRQPRDEVRSARLADRQLPVERAQRRGRGRAQQQRDDEGRVHRSVFTVCGASASSNATAASRSPCTRRKHSASPTSRARPLKPAAPCTL